MDDQTDGITEKAARADQKMTSEERKDDLITFEELGIDSIMVDEAHAFKNLAIFSKMNVSGITGPAAREPWICF